MDELEELAKSKDKCSQNVTLFDGKYDVPNEVNLLPTNNVLNNPINSVKLPPPLPGVFIFDQPNQKTNKSQIDLNFNPLITSSYDNSQSLSNIGPPNPDQSQKHKYSELDRSLPETISNQKYFQSSALYDYQSSEQKTLNKVQPIVVSDVDSLLPPQGNIYQSLQPVPVNIFDTLPYCEPKVYQQLEPVSRNEYRVDMEKFVEQKFYQELNPLSVNDSKLPKNEKKTYQQLRSVPDLHFIGGQSGIKHTTKTTQQKPEIPPEYATSKLYQQLSKPTKKQARPNHYPEVKSYHQLRPPGYVESPKNNLSKSSSQQVNLNTPRPVTTQASSKGFYQHQNNSQSYYRQPHKAFQHIKATNYDIDTNMADPTINPTPMSNLNFPNKTQSVQRGFQEHKPKVYLELRNPVSRKQTSVPSGSLQTNFAVDHPYQDLAANYDDGNITRHIDLQYQNVLPLHSQQRSDKQPNMRLPSPYEFKLPQTNISDKFRMPKIIDPNEYNGSQENRRAEQMLYTPTNRSLKSLNESVSSSSVIPPYNVGEEMSAGNINITFPKTPVCFDNPNANICKYNEEFNLFGNKNERNSLPTQVVSEITSESLHDFANPQINMNYSNSYISHISSSVCENKTMQNLSNDNRSPVVIENPHLTTNETNFKYNGKNLNKVSTDQSGAKDGTVDTTYKINGNIAINVEGRNAIYLESVNGSISDVRSHVSPDSNSKSLELSTGNSLHFSSIDSDLQSSKEKEFLYQKNDVSNVEKLSNNLQTANKVTINFVDSNVGKVPATPYSVTTTRVEDSLQNLKKTPSEEPTDLSFTSHAFAKKSNNSCLNNDSPPSSEPSSEITNIPNPCSENKKETLASYKVISQDKLLNESNLKCSESSNSSQSTGAPSTEVLVTGEIKSSTNEGTERDESVMSHSKDLAQTEAILQIGEQEKALTTCQSSFKLNTLLSDQVLDTGSSESESITTVAKACSESSNYSPIDIINAVQSESQLNSYKESKDFSKNYNISWSSKATSGQHSADLPQSDIIKKNQVESRSPIKLSPSISKIVKTVSMSNSEKSARDLCKIREENEKLLTERVSSPQYTSFIPKKNRILYKTQLLSSKISKSYSEMSTDSTSMILLSEKNSSLPETSLLDKTNKGQSDSVPISTVPEQNLASFVTVSRTNKDKSNLKINKSSELVDKECKSLNTQLQVEEKEKLRCKSLNINQTIQNNVVSKTQSDTTKEEMPLSKKECTVSQSNVLVKRLAKSKRQCVPNEGKPLTKNNKPQFLQNVSSDDSVVLERQSSGKTDKQPLSKKPKILQSEQHIDRSQTPPFVREQRGLSKFHIKTKKRRLQLVDHNSIDTTNEKDKEPKFDETAKVRYNKSQSTSIVSEQSYVGTRASMKRKVKDRLRGISESNTKSIALENYSEILSQDCEKLTVKDKVKNINSKRVYITSGQDTLENENIINKSASKDKIETKSLSSSKSKCLRVDTLHEKTSIKKKRKYCKTKKFEVLSAPRKSEPLLKSKYSKRIIKKKNLDFEPVEPVSQIKKAKKLLKRKYTITKLKHLEIKKDDSKRQIISGENLPSAIAKIKYEIVDPLEFTNEVRTASKEGLITDDEGEAVFLGFDSPQEEDDTVLGFDFKEEDDYEPINEFLQQLDADSMTVECDPRSLLQAPGVTMQCPQCGQALDSHQELVDHMQWHASLQSHDSSAHACRICLREFGTQAQLNKHSKWNHEGGKRFSCPVCSKCFTTSYYVKKHLATVHGQHEAELKYVCPECTLSFPSEKKLRKHVDKVHKKTLYQCNKCLRNFLRLANLERHKRFHEEEGQKFPCAYCNEKFDSRVKLHAHWPTHSEKKLFTCEICNSTFTALPSLRRHKILHAGEKLFHCDICQKSFALMSTLKTHLLVHSGIKRFPCKLCDKTFNRQDVLNAHQWIHTGEKKFECDICFQKFRWRHAVKSHKLIYHSTEKPYECEICGKRFSHPESFKKHGEVHAEKLYYCQICLKAFSRPSSLKIHILIHTDLKPFVCDLCNKGFRHKSHLRKHFLVHTSEKPWLCKFCNRMYKDRSQLRRHKRVVHCKNFFKKVLPNMPESLKTVENFEMIAEGDTSLHTNQELFHEGNILGPENLMSQSSKHFILSNLDGSFSNSEDNSVSDSMEDKSSNTEDNDINSAHFDQEEENSLPQTNNVKINGPVEQENVLPPSAF